MTIENGKSRIEVNDKILADAVNQYMQPSAKKAIWQLTNTMIPYISLWVMMILSIKLGYSYWITLGLVALAAAFQVRVFIFFHDCCHGCFFKSRKANKIIGHITGIMTLTPYSGWRRSHLAHHVTAGDLDNRGMGDIWTLTVKEFNALPAIKKLGYRLYRNPVVMFIIGPMFIFMYRQRFVDKSAPKKDRNSIYLTNFVLLGILVLSYFTIGLSTLLMIQVPLTIIAGAMGIWLFYVQHQYEDVYWEHNDNWEPTRAAIDGSSYYKLPKVLQWFTGNIGLHHIHHLNPRIPNYNLPACQREVEIFHHIEPLTMRKSIKSIWMKLWDEKGKRLISFREAKSVTA